MSNFGQMVVNTFENLTPDLQGIYDAHKTKTLNEFTGPQSLSVLASGAASGALPGLHLLGATADLAFLMNRMAVCCYGIGAIKGHQALKVDVLEREDFALILALWAGDEDVARIVSSKIGADLLVVGGAKVGLKAVSKGIGHQLGVISGKKLAGKVGAKVGAKIGAKAGAKFAAGWIPVLGGVVGAGVNAYFLSDVMAAAQRFYDFKVEFIREHGLIQAHMTAAPAPALPAAQPADEQGGIIGELHRLGDLRSKQIITETEFELLKANLLRTLTAG
ncbi:hypothetical protein [Deinococcus aerophilus]|uniref:Uncharacterized protein n=1 Tax=Deinococcus aerophilus TaxID=522488 RepID=A0ABQ2GYF9_9DEIO|nr:hypothetical protein [Deinococcus aerophilus]GGM18419.1 hypothetical protein GCM10010841_28160 [Deinococcus aerophilus]